MMREMICLAVFSSVKQKCGKAKNHMQYDDQQQNNDPMNQDNPLDSPRKKAGDQTRDAIDNAGKSVPGGQQYADQAQQAAGQGFDNPQQQGQAGFDKLQQQGQQDMAGIGNMAGRQPDSPQASDREDPNNPYGNVDDVVADYSNRSTDPSQQNPTSL
jgi:hypothetical protein